MKVVFTDYALMRMKMRDVLEEEVVEALKQQRSKHKKGKQFSRMEVRHKTGDRTLLVIYKRQNRKMIVINAMWE